uniref:Uncharacterized protein n=1 Tax=Salarias fasciatus TaxID=181472 RepID=A0A672HWE8_SALFA
FPPNHGQWTCTVRNSCLRRHADKTDWLAIFCGALRLLCIFPLLNCLQCKYSRSLQSGLILTTTVA